MTDQEVRVHPRAHSSDPGPALDAADLVKEFRDGSSVVRAVDGVSLSVRRGELVAIVGPSGSGKSTLLALLGGLLSPTTGMVQLDGEPLSELPERTRARLRAQRIGFVFQQASLVPYLTARENIEVVGDFAKMPRTRSRRRAKELLDRLGLADRSDHRPHALSGGERQRVAIARALLSDPVMLLADEPTASLDRERGRDVVETLADATRRNGRGGVIVTHDDDVAAAADRRLSLRDGRTVDA